MKFELPVASRQRLDELFEYLGDRAEDFKKCFDIESDWCWKYADLMLRGLQTRSLEYGELHHIVPLAYYKNNGYKGKREAKVVSSNNLAALTYTEHVFAHYFAVQSAQQTMRSRLARAFIVMLNVRNTGTHTLDVSEEELLRIVPVLEQHRIRGMIEQIAQVSREGRTHRWENPAKARSDYYFANKASISNKAKVRRELNKDADAARNKKWRADNKEYIAEKGKKYRTDNADYIRDWKKSHYEANKSSILTKHAEYRELHLDEEKVRHHNYYETHKSEIAPKQKEYRENHKEEIAEYKRAYRETHKDTIAEQQHDWYENNKPMILERNRNKYAENKELYSEKNKLNYEKHKEARCARVRAYRQEKRAAGYREIRDKATGKKHWVFVGITEQKAA